MVIFTKVKEYSHTLPNTDALMSLGTIKVWQYTRVE